MSIEATSKFNLIWLLSYISIASVSAAIITPALPEIQSHFALSLGTVEWIISAFLIGYVVGQLIYGPLANQFGRLKALRIGLTINLFGVIICFMALAVNAYWLLIIQQFPRPHRLHTSPTLQLFHFANFFGILTSHLSRRIGFRSDVTDKEVFVSCWTIN